MTDGAVIEINNPQKFPDPSGIKEIDEPIIDATVITSEESLGEILKLLEEKRGNQKKFEYIGTGRVLLTYELPLNEIVLDFYDRLKSASRGYASLDYHLSGHRVSPMVKLDVPGGRRTGGRAVDDRAPRFRPGTRQRPDLAAAQTDPPPAV